ncbi:MAG: hypothetical protein ACI4GD_10970 [Lachnospiraceae bacterium]
MNEIKYAIALNNISEIYIEEADIFFVKRKEAKRYAWTLKVACLIAFFFGIMFILQKISLYSNYSDILSIQAYELGNEEYQLGVSLHEIIYADENKVILYDFRGIYVYSFNKEKMIGYADFRNINMDIIQGDNPTFVKVFEDGEIIIFYNNEHKYIFDVKENNVREVNSYEELDESKEYHIDSIILGEENSISDNQITYVGTDGAFLTVEIDYNEITGDEPVKYKNIFIIRVKDGTKSHYRLFK